MPERPAPFPGTPAGLDGRTEAQVERRHDEAREKQRRAERKAGERAARWHAEEMADAQKDATRRREQLANTVATRVRQLMEPQGHPGLSDDAGIARAARHADLSAEAAASNDRQVSALDRCTDLKPLRH